MQIFSGVTTDSFENKWRQKYGTLIAMGRFILGYPYSQMLHNTKCCNVTTKIDKKKKYFIITIVLYQTIIMHNIIKFRAWAEPYVNFL